MFPGSALFQSKPSSPEMMTCYCLDTGMGQGSSPVSNSQQNTTLWWGCVCILINNSLPKESPCCWDVSGCPEGFLDAPTERPGSIVCIIAASSV